ncbi:hypothetical protein HNQ57_000752 [Zhongshania antarctica]|jgi:hypothetical protein|uniref:Uncharacterized protein n=1 Tax=Zhongshania antarctica TaxID=641702 RepID=A0A840R250_9GAMM|nr:DUF6447 family protein [Zhongshania antarctica]MBB5186491.1 hypothetical protein [Zhongshania antarctica]
MNQEQMIKIDGKEYPLESLDNEAKNQLMNLRVADQKIAAVQQDLAMLQTARNAYAKALAESLPKVTQ